MSDEHEKPEAPEESAPEESGAEGHAVDAASDEPADDEATSAEPSTDETAAAEPDAAEPVADDPSASEPSTEESAASEPSTDEPVAAELSTDDPSAAEPEVDAPAQLPPSAGARADRRARAGVSLGSGVWLVAICAVLSAVAVGVLYVGAPSPAAVEVSEQVQLQTGGVARVNLLAEQQLQEARRQLEQTCAALADAIVASVPAPTPAPAPEPAAASTESAASGQVAHQPAPATPPATSPAVTFDAASLKQLQQRIEEVRKGYPGLRGAVLDPDGKLVHAVGGPEPGEPQLAELLDALRAGTPLPGALVGASSLAKQGAPRVVLVVPAPQLPAAELNAAREVEELARVQQAKLLEVARAGAAQREGLVRLNLQLFAAAGAGALLVILALLFGVIQPLRRSLTEFAFRASERASGREPAAGQPLPRELATADELQARAFEAARAELEQASARTTLASQLDQLIEVCEQASGGDLSARAIEGEGDSGALARNLNFLIESFERRALRLRSHAKAPADERAQEEAVGELRQRAVALNAMVQLLADIAARLQGFSDKLQEGEEVEPELRRLGEAIAVRTRTARAYLAALHQAIDDVMQEQPGAPDAKLSAQIEAELAGLKLDTSFPAQVGALKDLGPDELRRRIEAEEAELAEEQEGAGAE